VRLLRPVCLLTLVASVARAGTLDERIFEGKAPGERVSVLVVLRDQADLSEAETIADPAEKRRFVVEALRAQAEATQAPLRSRLLAEGRRFRPFYVVNMLEVEADPRLASELAARADVARVAPNRPFSRPALPRTEPEATPQAAAIEQNVSKIRAPDVWAHGATGQGIVVGDADTGVVWDHPALKAHYRGWSGTSVSHDYSWHDAIHDARVGNPCGSDAPAPCDDNGHGTGTASLAVGDDGAGNQVGVAPGAKFIACRNMDQGAGTPARYTECFEWFLAPTDSHGQNARPDLGADVINNSWGCPDSEGCTEPDVLQAVVENVRAAGLFVAVAASNGGPACSTLDVPAYYEASFTVGATDLQDDIAGFSSRGPVTADGSNRLKPDLCAPGVGLRVATIPSGFGGGFSGTSGSTPMVAGAVALLWSAVPALTGQPVASADILRHSAVPLVSAQDCGSYPGASVPNAVFGWGRLDVEAAVERAAPLTARPEPSRVQARPVPRRVAPRF
jgi:subtilisin family serine protease